MQKLSAILLAALVGMGVASPHASATPAQQRNVIILGDSMVADPWAGDVVVNRLRGGGQCPRSAESYAEQAARQAGLEARNFSCAGSQVNIGGPFLKTAFADQVDAALPAIDPNTTHVWITQGFNDTWSGFGPEAYLDGMSWHIARIRERAPQATITMIGYPSITSNGQLCLARVIPGAPGPVPAVQVADMESQAQEMQRELARRTGIDFVDVRSQTPGNGMCSPDDVRYVSALIDTTGPVAHMPFHINERGHREMAHMVVDQLGL